MPPSLPSANALPSTDISQSSPNTSAPGPSWAPTRTASNAFGLIREYYGPLPLQDPEDEVPLAELVDNALLVQHTETRPQRSRGILIAPYPSMSTYLLGRWYWNGHATKSEEDRDDLIKNCLLHKDFRPEELRGVNWKKIDCALATGKGSENEVWGSRDGWKHADIPIKVPFGKELLSKEFIVRGLAYRPLEEVIEAVCSSELSAGFHYSPYQLLWQPPRTREGCLPPIERIYGELYSSRAFLEEDARLQASPREPDCNLPRAVIARMPWSDSTHLAEYGNASLWPIYLLFGNQSKYARGRPSSNACHHVAYIPKVSMAYSLLSACFLKLLYSCHTAPRQH